MRTRNLLREDDFKNEIINDCSPPTIADTVVHTGHSECCTQTYFRGTIGHAFFAGLYYNVVTYGNTFLLTMAVTHFRYYIRRKKKKMIAYNLSVNKIICSILVTKGCSATGGCYLLFDRSFRIRQVWMILRS